MTGAYLPGITIEGAGRPSRTAVEVGVFYLEALEPVLVPILLVLSAAKFTMVVGFFMHLKFDSKLYRALFVGPLVVAVAVMMAMFLLYGVFSA